MDRRDFIKMTPWAFFISFFIYGCGSSRSGSRVTDSGGDSGNDGGNSGGNGYSPLVTSPNSLAEYFLAGKKVSQYGEAIFNSGTLNSVILTDRNGSRISGLDSIFFSEANRGTKSFFILDSQKRFAPYTAVSGENGSLLNLEKGQTTINNNIITRTATSNVPAWNSENIGAIPGIYFLGNRSFRELAQSGPLVNAESASVNFISSNSLVSYGLATKNGTIPSNLNEVISSINMDPPKPFMTINGDTKFSAYALVSSESAGEPPVAVLSLEEVVKPQYIDIKYLFPSEIGNSWTFRAGSQTATSKIIGTKNINGKTVLVYSDVAYGVEGYFGFYNDIFYCYGFNVPGIGAMFIDPPVKFGDGQVSVGKNYRTSSKVIYESVPQLTSVKNETTLTVEGREDVYAGGKYYGDCVKIREDGLTTGPDPNTGKETEISMTVYHWFAKNVGKVKVSVDGLTAELIDATLINKNEHYNPSAKLSVNFRNSGRIYGELPIARIVPFSL